MSETVIEVHEETVEEQTGNPMVAMARKVLLASIGAVSLAQEEIEDFVNKLIERGEVAERDGRRLLTDVMEKRKNQVKEVENDLEARIEDVLSRLNVPTKDDIEALGSKIMSLTRKVDALKKDIKES
ncbi:MAG: phasin family protein [Ardenticatenaceae bacterium]|nr:phasin family protein [Ardenticatenaceae bacterium]